MVRKTLSFLLVTSEFLFYYHCLSVCGVQLTDRELHHTLINPWPIDRSLVHFDTHHPRPLMMNHMHILVRTAYSGIHLNIMNCDRFLYRSECSILVKVT